MRATVVQLRYKMNDVLKALDRNEDVVILYHGKEKGILKSLNRKLTVKEMMAHPYFGMDQDSKKSVEEIMDELRSSRYGDI